ncbi:hypothetical protein [Xanthomonas phaseoli]|uniref:hypothetical protein n=1 Tax=Xanthomonas phaseoli TaxID=1985254 RepID=UPI001237A11D|nr:hypothetical protein [Xanthomonas phaseoli]MBO9834734.1 hypothetical protein [Xanthomonas phaseoli pv. dieffenbachiae]MBO9838872.1 hypothetical protein [Xanthomonas phaseoli pv. dieffenbachiae]MBO9842925.1 hypothetical protein [Xanthomonas phaseoli pv. dieffenbachiae]MBO9863499.1 hypothetical protein [Xanthomonas phaseoli pv. dieffenbachiae]MBO9867682.1 hypothetical protein [Xanthomonas phaseoli pv. dieffenbachiae]
MNSKSPLGKLGQRAARNSQAAEAMPAGFDEPMVAATSPAVRAVPSQPAEGGKVQGKRRRGTNESGVVTMTVRLRREDWARLVELRMTEGKTGQEVFFEGLTAVFARYGFDAPVAP